VKSVSAHGFLTNGFYESLMRLRKSDPRARRYDLAT
jgi:hypothetical protein